MPNSLTALNVDRFSKRLSVLESIVERPVEAFSQAAALLEPAREPPKTQCLLNALSFAVDVAEVLASTGLVDEQLENDIESIIASLVRALGLNYVENAAYYASLKERNTVEAITILGGERFLELVEYIATATCNDENLVDAVLVLADAYNPRKELLAEIDRAISSGDCNYLKLLAFLVAATPPLKA